MESGKSDDGICSKSEKSDRPQRLTLVRKLLGEYEKKIVDVAILGHNMIKNPLNKKLKSEEMMKIKSPIGKKVNSLRNKRFSKKKQEKIAYELKNAISSSPCRKFVDRKEKVRSIC